MPTIDGEKVEAYYGLNRIDGLGYKGHVPLTSRRHSVYINSPSIQIASMPNIILTCSPYERSVAMYAYG